MTQPSTPPTTQSALGGSASLHGSIINSSSPLLLPAFAPGHTSLAASWSLILPPKPTGADAAPALHALQDAGSYAIVGVWSGVPHGGAEGMEEGGCGGCGHVLLDEEILASWSVEDKGWGDGHDGIVGLDTVACPSCRARFHPRLEICCWALDAHVLARAFPEHALPGAVRSPATCLVLGSGGSSGGSTAGGVDVPAASARQPVAQLRSDIAALLHKARAQQPKEKGSSNAPGSAGGLQSLTLHIESLLAGSGPVGFVVVRTPKLTTLIC